MGYGDRDGGQSVSPEDQAGPGGTPWSMIGAATGVFVRLVGIILLIVGLWVAVNVVVEAWRLYQDPARIERIAERIQAVPVGGEDASGAAADSIDARLAYLLAWPLALALLLLLGRLAFWALAHGGALALGRAGGPPAGHRS